MVEREDVGRGGLRGGGEGEVALDLAVPEEGGEEERDEAGRCDNEGGEGERVGAEHLREERVSG